MSGDNHTNLHQLVPNFKSTWIYSWGELDIYIIQKTKKVDSKITVEILSEPLYKGTTILKITAIILQTPLWPSLAGI